MWFQHYPPTPRIEPLSSRHLPDQRDVRCISDKYEARFGAGAESSLNLKPADH